EMPLARLETVRAARILAEGPSGWARRGEGVAIRFTPDALHLDIAEGWSLAADAAEGRHALRVEGAQVAWPDPGMADGHPAWTGTLILPLRDAGPTVTLTYQPCTQAECLMPVRLEFRCA
ncbi:hypothetical protein, partial [Roseobacter sp. HKCCA0434]|uniref:hypothetical protein n=1 Tax=Roseobacter sp. HKCCA0434 TaxID=3079297 RepID=UPI002905A2DE